MTVTESQISSDGLDPWIAAEDLSNTHAVLGIVRAVEAEIEHAQNNGEYYQISHRAWSILIRKFPSHDGKLLKKWVILKTYLSLCEQGQVILNPHILKALQVKKIRSLSGVTPVTVLTKPFPCPGRCIFCPTDVRMPKSYLADEPGAMRAFRADFDPYTQVNGRIATLYANGHPVDKIELLILGGTWSSYPKNYQSTFIQRCFDAMNQVNSESLAHAHQLNESAQHRNVGLVVETRPDHVTHREISWMRSLGVTKVQMGLQSMNDHVLKINHRGHTVAQSAKALRRLRRAGFKLVLHWMPNLLGATPQQDLADFKKIWSHPDIQPDELKIYPCSLLENAELYEYWKRGEWQAYSDEELIELTAECKKIIPPYCRINRVFRDIHPHHIVTGMNRLNFRQMVQAYMQRHKSKCNCIRCREIKDLSEYIQLEVKESKWPLLHPLSDQGSGLPSIQAVLAHQDLHKKRTQEIAQKETQEIAQMKEEVLERSQKEIQDHLQIYQYPYTTSISQEIFLSFETNAGKLAGFLRLSLPFLPEDNVEHVIELKGAALVREVHVYGASLHLGSRAPSGQHQGLGTRLLTYAEKISQTHGYTRLAIIASIGTRLYYQARGYHLADTYMIKDL
jgi:histone acetyltransferase (RNA polymerase elongator complex component)